MPDRRSDPTRSGPRWKSSYVWRAAGWLAGQVRPRSRDAPPADEAVTASSNPPLHHLALHLAHELNNVLSVVLAAADVIEKGSALADARSAAVGIAAAAQEGLDLTARVAALAREHDLIALPCDIAGTLAASRLRLERAAGGRGELRMELTSRVLPALIDRDQFVACVVELVHDTRLASKPGVIVLRTRLADQVGPRDERALGVLVEVESETAAFRPKPGTIAGLAEASSFSLVESFARRSGGRLDRIRSDSLTRSTLRLPLMPSGSRIRPARMGRRRTAGDLPAATKAVVVEDNDFLRGVLVRGLRERGLDVNEARDAAEARGVLGADIAVLVTDVVLPGDMDGFTLAQWARDRDPHVALLFVSGFMSARLPEVLTSDELTSFVRKPIELEGLLAVLDGLLAVRDEQAPRGGGAPPAPDNSISQD